MGEDEMAGSDREEAKARVSVCGGGEVWGEGGGKGVTGARATARLQAATGKGMKAGGEEEA